MRQFTPAENNTLKDLLKRAFNRDAFKIMLSSRLGFRFDDYVSVSPFDTQLFELLEAANMENWNFQLLNAVLAARPNNADLQNFSQQTGLLGVTDKGLEALVSKSAFHDATKLLTRLSEIFGQVCRIEINGKQEGTGFLVSPDLVLTNYHVAKKFIDNPALTSQVVARFDFRSMGNGPAVYTGTTVKLAATNPVADYKPYDPIEAGTIALTTSIAPDKLDYALLRLEKAIGSEPGGPRFEGATPEGGEANQQRGWIKYPNPAPDFVKDSPLFIVQHPALRPMEIAFETKAILGLDPNGVRVRYNVNTEGGSSGSPCFNENWQWVALHHYGTEKNGFNQGVPVGKIMAALPPALLAELSPETV